MLRDVRPIGLDDDAAGPPDLVDVLVEAGMIRQVAAGLTAPADVPVVDGGGRFVAPGLWDHHVHLEQWALQQVRLDTAGTSSVDEVVALLRDHIAQLGEGDPGSVVHAWGHRSAGWSRRGTAAELDAVCGSHPVVLISGDGHHGWLSSSALRRLGLPTGEGTGVVEEAEWFAAYARLTEVFGPDPHLEDGLRLALEDAAARGVVGIVDLEFSGSYGPWPDRVARGLDTLRVVTATYEDGLDDVVGRGLRTGDPLGDSGLVTMGPLKIISDGSLNTRTAFCCAPYGGGGDHGVQNYPPERLREVAARAHAAGLECAVHAIGDAAVRDALDAFEATGARGSLEHAQLVRWQDVPRMAALRLRASVQPAHLLDDRDVTETCWGDRTDRCFALRAMADAGVRLALGSDAPVSPLDPWLAMAAAVHRSADERGAWHPEQALTVREAFAASVDGQRVTRGARGDLVLLDADPTVWHGDSAEVGARLRGLRPTLTVVAGRVVHGA
ncbi:hypothetical protein ADJ73_02615 [Arsenicicoccus sp. oral taxon 190]|nr:hypothetical protein ADJ73_02615 [Arsenicicoccus sp. oral taxon 190]